MTASANHQFAQETDARAGHGGGVCKRLLSVEHRHRPRYNGIAKRVLGGKTPKLRPLAHGLENGSPCEGVRREDAVILG